MLTASAHNSLTAEIINAAIEVHTQLGPGLLESTYVPCLEYELRERNLRYVAERQVPITYKGLALNAAYRLDLVVEDAVVVEVKSVATVLPIHQAQVITYLNLTGCPAGLIINFNVPRLVDGVKRLTHPRLAVRTERTPKD